MIKNGVSCFVFGEPWSLGVGKYPSNPTYPPNPPELIVRPSVRENIYGRIRILGVGKKPSNPTRPTNPSELFVCEHIYGRIRIQIF